MSGESPNGIAMRQFLDIADKALNPDKNTSEVSDELIEVRHMEDTAKYRPIAYDSWKEYWIAKSDYPFPTSIEKCACCQEPTEPKDFVGAHIKEIKYPYNEYIYLLCKSCNDTYGKGKENSPIFKVKKSHCVPFSLDEAIENVERPEE